MTPQWTWSTKRTIFFANFLKIVSSIFCSDHDLILSGLVVCSTSWEREKLTKGSSSKQSQSLIMWKRSQRNFQHLTHTWLKVRWAMDYMNIPYEEEENSGILGIMALGRSVPQLKVNNMSDYFRAIFQIPQADLTITNSADILRYLYGCHAGRSSTK